MSSSITVNNPATKPKRRIIRRDKNKKQAIPDSLLKNEELNSIITNTLPKDYDFEIYKTLWKIECLENCEHVVLQMPEGLLMYSCVIADILQRFATANKLKVTILGDVTYGACCVDDLGAAALGADLLVHYGHSCLVPVTCTVIPVLYVFVELQIDVKHVMECVRATLVTGDWSLQVMGTVQFRGAVAAVHKHFNDDFLNSQPDTSTLRICAEIPQAKPLSPGEVLGCTAPQISVVTASGDGDSSHTTTTTVMLFIADGRFHLEAAMIANPSLRALRYDPYSKVLTEEGYETEKMKDIRYKEIQRAKTAKTYGIILGTLGRQGNPAILGRIKKLLRRNGKRCFVILLSEVFPKKLQMMPQADAWVQVACPRLSIDWGHFFEKPLLSAYELEVCMSQTDWRETYPMDFYLNGSGEWTNYHDSNRQRRI